MKLNRKLVLVLALLVSIAMATTGTLAYLTDTDEAVNVMTLGNVDIEQYEVGADGKPFAQAQPLYPVYNDIGKITKKVSVENTGNSDAYVRTWFAFEAGNLADANALQKLITISCVEGVTITWLDSYATIDGSNYIVGYVLYPEAVKPGETVNSLESFYMVHTAGNADVAQFGATYEVLVLTQAVQTNNMPNAAAAMTAAFGDNQPWGNDVAGLPTTTVKTAAELKEALANGGIVVLANDVELDADETITIAAGKTARLDLAGHELKADLSGQGDVHTALITVKKGASLTINGNGNVHAIANKTKSAVSAIINNDAGTVTINGGNYTMDYGTYNDGYLIPTIVDNNSNVGNANLIINGGTFTHDRNMFRNFSNAASHNDYKTVAKITINGGTFIADGDGAAAIWNQKPSANTPAGAGVVEINGGTFASVTVSDDWGTIPEEPAAGNVMVAAANADTLVEALESGKDVLLTDDVKIDPAGMSNAYGTTGINVKNGQTIDGNGNTLDIKGAGGTWDSGISTTGGLIKNITVTGSFRGIFINHTSTYSETVVLENVIIDGTVYTISCDQGMNQNLEATNSTFNGWTSYAATLGTAKFTNCSFGEGSGYAYCRPYAPTEFVGCDFEAGFEMDARAAVTFENCTIGGVALTAENLATLVTSNIANATVK